MLYCVFKTNPPVSISLTLATNLSYKVFLATSTTLISLLRSVGTDFSISVSVLSTSNFNLAKSHFAAKANVSPLLNHFGCIIR